MLDSYSDLMVSNEEPIEVDAETAAAIELGICAADDGRFISSEKVPQLIAQWVSK